MKKIKNVTINKKAFTLIELLAVIVILAIIALIATPIVLNIIKDSKNKVGEHNIELYARAIENAISKGELKNQTQPGSYASSKDGKELYLNGKKVLDIEYEGNEIYCSQINISKESKVYLNGCTIGSDSKKYTYGALKFSSVCTAVNVASEGTYTAGDKYECKVDPDKEPYTFFVLTTVESGSKSINLIMNANINLSGEAITSPTQDKGIIPWVSKEDYNNDSKYNTYGNNNKGPITAMNYLKSATLNWTNVPMLKETYNDEGGHFVFDLTGYRARLPYYSEINDTGCTTSAGSCPLYIANYLQKSSYVTGASNIYGLQGYWILSSHSSGSKAWSVGWNGYLIGDHVKGYSFTHGVRPVITLAI